MSALVTGMGLVTPVGTGVDQFWRNLCAGVSGFREITLFPAAAMRNRMAGEIPGYPPGPVPRSVRMLTDAVREALAHAGLAGDRERLGRTALVLGTNFGVSGAFSAYAAARRGGPTAPETLGDLWFETMARAAADACGLGGPVAVVSVACASGIGVLDAGLMFLDDADTVVCAAADELTLYTYAGLNALRAITKDAIRPFTRDRGGTQFAEGAAAVVLERPAVLKRRGGRAAARLEAVYMNNDAYHVTAPDQEGRGIIAVMRGALAAAAAAPESIVYLNAHGTGTVYNDAVETLAIKAVFGAHTARLHINAVKSMTGHGMGAAGLIEFIATVQAIRTGVIPPTMGGGEPDPALDLDYTLGRAVTCPVPRAMTNSYGIGGANACAILAAAGD
ncbi:MAG: beta-ketoacyl-[acyl-carrier-protein] synthase family protein [Planctomycetota bacterium]